ncbi:uncharacterized protein LOC121834873 [Ixodes scapularis]|uniref:uncharacterized protein LOC121834873 n=1 Tax=Ixodes scapularis TaxID=6945 RepID=UPI001C3822F7|nr:uncharacterized protein LOC121834873 [Ixodes scapularis]
MAASVKRVKKGCERDLLDRCSVSLFFFTGSARIPGSAQELANTCEEEQKDRQCVTDYTQTCLEGIPRGMVQLVLDGSSTVGREKCTVGSPGHTRYMKHAECLNTAGDKIHRCMKRLTGILEASAEHHERKHKIGLACCSFGGYRQCIVDAVKGSCDDSHVAYAHELIETYAGVLLDTVCINYKAEDESCRGLPTLLPKDAPRSLSPIPPLTDVLQVFV